MRNFSSCARTRYWRCWAMPSGSYVRRKLTVEETSRVGTVWRTTSALPKLGKRRAKEPRQPVVPRAFPCVTCTVPTVVQMWCDDCQACVMCDNCAAGHASALHGGYNGTTK